MSTISVPLTKEHQELLDQLVKSGVGSSRAVVMRKALEEFAEKEALLSVLEAEQDVAKGLVYKGDLRKIVGM